MILVKLRTLVLPARRKDTGRPPEGHRKGNKSLVRAHSECDCKNTCTPEGNRKGTGRAPEGNVPLPPIDIGYVLYSHMYMYIYMKMYMYMYTYTYTQHSFLNVCPHVPNRLFEASSFLNVLAHF